jgi:hypothetical protein
MPERTCILHIGTHKTGTTSLQAMLSLNRAAFAATGVYFPPVGMTQEYSGNHKIAWDLMSGNFSNHVEDFLTALRVSPLPVAIASSEDLSLLHPDPGTFAKLSALIGECGYRTKVIVYLRAQAPFAESMYAERIKHGDIKRLSDYLHEILTTGTFSPRLSVPIAFEYGMMLDRIAAAIGKENIAVRPYPVPIAGDNGIYADFLGAMNSLVPEFNPNEMHIEVAGASTTA